MHIRIEDDSNKTVALLCLERGHNIARIIFSAPEHVRNLENIAQNLGADAVMVVTKEVDEKKALLDVGFSQAVDWSIMLKVLNETKSKRG